jgi:hypothetical protein
MALQGFGFAPETLLSVEVLHFTNTLTLGAEGRQGGVGASGTRPNARRSARSTPRCGENR